MEDIVTFAPVMTKRGWLYLPGSLFDGCKHPVVISTTEDNEVLLIDVDFGAVVLHHLSAKNAPAVITDYTYRRDVNFPEKIKKIIQAEIKDFEAEFEPKPPIHNFNVDDPKAKEFMKKFANWGGFDA